MATRKKRKKGGTVGIPYVVFAVLPDKGLAYVGQSRALGADVRELRHLEEVHSLLVGDLVYLGRSWWLRGVDSWIPADPYNMPNPPVYGGVEWSPAFANELLSYAADHEQNTIFRMDALARKFGNTTNRSTK